MFTSLALSLLLSPAPVQYQRVYQPIPHDPSSHGGRIESVNAGDITVDGRLAILSREHIWSFDAQGNPIFRTALVAVTVDPDMVQSNATGYLDKFLDDLSVSFQFQGNQVTLYGSNHTFSPFTDAHVIEWPEHFQYADDPPSPLPPYAINNGVLPLPHGVRGVAVTLRELDDLNPPYGENPFPSDADGNYLLTGTHTCYELSMVDVDYTWTWDDDNEVWIYDKDAGVRLGLRDLQVVVNNAPARPKVVSTTLGAFEELAIGPAGGSAEGDPIYGHEPTITGDGRLILYHGAGKLNGPPLFQGGPPWGRVTYVYDHDPDPDQEDWSSPKSITQMYVAEVLTEVDRINGIDPVYFPEVYGLALNPIREPTGTVVFDQPDDTIRGPYPWVDKDGGFYTAMYTFSDDATLNCPGVTDPCTESCGAVATRSGFYAVGDITQGYMKHVDDIALNPTRAGGSMDWPPGEGQRNSIRLFTPTTGLKPSLWEPLIGEGVPVPSQDASMRIPVLPVFSINLDMYGEIRFEEADGNYILYLAGNEGFTAHHCNNSGNGVDPLFTPDTSGGSSRARCELKSGAAFPHEAYSPGSTPDVASAYLRQNIGTPTSPSHECVGFKGQALMFPETGYVDVTGISSSYAKEFTVQAFVKRLSGATGPLTIVEDPGRFVLRLNSDGEFEVTVWVDLLESSEPESIQVPTLTSSLTAAAPETDAFDPTAGWTHVAVAYNGDLPDPDSGSELRIYVDGELDPSAIVAPATDTQIAVGSGGNVTVGPNDPNGGGAYRLILDEIALSDVRRTAAEIRRDAYVDDPDAPQFDPWPSGVPLELGLDPAETKWPQGVTHTQEKEDLGRDLFAATILSQNGTMSCATCHETDDHFTEDSPTLAVGLNGPTNFNTPTVLNSAFGTHKFFDGRAASLEEQSTIPIETEMNLPLGDAIARLNNDPTWVALFDTAFEEPPNEENLAEALALYQRTLNSGDSAFDQDKAYREGAGGSNALTVDEKRGRALFFGKARCFGCHRGSALSDDDFHNIHSVDDSGPVLGRGGFTGRDSENGMLKVPTLRNIEGTAPYFHDGHAATLEDVVDHYDRGGGFTGTKTPLGPLDRHLLPLFLSQDEKDDLVAFLKALSGSEPQ